MICKICRKFKKKSAAIPHGFASKEKKANSVVTLSKMLEWAARQNKMKTVQKQVKWKIQSFCFIFFPSKTDCSKARKNVWVFNWYLIMISKECRWVSLLAAVDNVKCLVLYSSKVKTSQFSRKFAVSPQPNRSDVNLDRYAGVYFNATDFQKVQTKQCFNFLETKSEKLSSRKAFVCAGEYCFFKVLGVGL